MAFDVRLETNAASSSLLDRWQVSPYVMVYGHRVLTGRFRQSQSGALARSSGRPALLPQVLLDLHGVRLAVRPSASQGPWPDLFHAQGTLSRRDPGRSVLQAAQVRNRAGGSSNVYRADDYNRSRILEYETVIPATPDPAHRNGGGSSPGSRAAAAAHQAVTVQGPGLADLLTRDPPGRPPSAGGHQHRPSTSASVRNSQLQERFDRLEEIIEQVGRQGPGDSPARAMVDSDENSRGTWCNQLGPHAFEEKLDGDGSEEGTRAEVSSQLIDMLTPLQSVDEVNKVGQEAETRKGQ